MPPPEPAPVGANERVWTDPPEVNRQVPVPWLFVLTSRALGLGVIP